MCHPSLVSSTLLHNRAPSTLNPSKINPAETPPFTLGLGNLDPHVKRSKTRFPGFSHPRLIWWKCMALSSMFKIVLLASRHPVLLCFLHTQHLMARVLLCWAELAEAMFHGSDKCLILVFSILDTNCLDRSTCQVLCFGYLFHFLSQEYLRKKHSGTCGKNSNSGLISKERKHVWSKENSTRGSPSNENVSSLI